MSFAEINLLIIRQPEDKWACCLSALKKDMEVLMNFFSAALKDTKLIFQQSCPKLPSETDYSFLTSLQMTLHGTFLISSSLQQ